MMAARVDRDPDRIPGAPPGYRPLDDMLGKSPPSPNDPEVSPTEADRSRAGGSNHDKPERDVRDLAPDAASTPPGPSPRGSGGPHRSRPVRNSPGKADAAGWAPPPNDPARFAR
jgi:hypothetical protein